MRDYQPQLSSSSSLTSSESDMSLHCSPVDIDNSSSSNDKKWEEAVSLDDASDSSDGGTESGPER